MRIEELVLEGTTLCQTRRRGLLTYIRVQILSCEDPDNWMGLFLQCHHGSQWVGQVQHSRRDLLRPRHYEHVPGTCLLDRSVYEAF